MEYSSENPLLSTFTNQMKNSFGCEHDSDRQNQLNEEYFISSNTIMTEKYRDSHIYANIQEMQEESRNRLPPIPPNINEAVRELEHGWREFVTECGRPYFFNIETGICQWKPPRSLAPPSLSSEHLVSASSTNDVSSSPTDGKGFLSATSWTESCIQDAVESLPSRLDETIISCDHSVVSGRNRGDDKQVAGQPFSKELMERVRAFKSNEELAAIEVANLASPSARCSHDIKHSDSSGLFSLGFSKNSIKCGTMEKCKIAEAGQKLKRRDWSSCYIFLSSAHLIFYKDEKSAEKSGKHYEAPLGMCDLRGARLHWVETERDRRKKRPVFQLELIDGTIYHFSASPAENLSDWYLCLREVVSKLPRPDIYPTPVIEREDAGSFVARNSSHFPNSSSALGSSQYRHSTKKAKYDAACSSTVNEKVVTDATPNRETIIEKLKRFFRSRPSIETLKEKGIYRPEPVFGSTLASICQHEQSEVPRFIKVVTEVIEAKGLDVDGLYRVSGNLSAIQKIRCQVDQEQYVALLAEEDVHVLTGALKLFFRELSEPIIPAHMAKDFISANRQTNGESKVERFDELLKKLPTVNRETLKVLFRHLLNVANHASKNRMEVHNLAIMFGPSLFSSGAENTDGSKKGKRKNAEKKSQEKAASVQSNSHLAFNLIMQVRAEWLTTEIDERFRKQRIFLSGAMIRKRFTDFMMK